jgi:hypothetical protein
MTSVDDQQAIIAVKEQQQRKSTSDEPASTSNCEEPKMEGEGKVRESEF